RPEDASLGDAVEAPAVGAGEGREAAGQDPVPSDQLHFPTGVRHRSWARRGRDRALAEVDPRNRLAAFRPAIIAIRWGTAGVGLVLAAGSFQRQEWPTMAW